MRCNWYLKQKIQFKTNLDMIDISKTNLKLDLTTPLTAPPWVYLAQTIHSTCLFKIRNRDCHLFLKILIKLTVSSFFRTAAGDLSSTENWREDYNSVDWEKLKKKRNLWKNIFWNLEGLLLLVASRAVKEFHPKPIFGLL